MVEYIVTQFFTPGKHNQLKIFLVLPANVMQIASSKP